MASSSSRVLVLAVLALLGVGCSKGAPVRPVKMSAAGLEAFLAQKQPTYSRITCGRGADGWDYVCRFRIGLRVRKVAFAVNDRFPVRATLPVAVNQPISAGVQTAAQTEAVFRRAAARACAAARARVRAVPAGSALARRLAVAAAAERDEAAALARVAWAVPARLLDSFYALKGELTGLAAANVVYYEALVAHRPAAKVEQAGAEARVAENLVARSRVRLGLRCA